MLYVLTGIALLQHCNILNYSKCTRYYFILENVESLEGLLFMYYTLLVLTLRFQDGCPFLPLGLDLHLGRQYDVHYTHTKQQLTTTYYHQLSFQLSLS